LQLTICYVTTLSSFENSIEQGTLNKKDLIQCQNMIIDIFSEF